MRIRVTAVLSESTVQEGQAQFPCDALTTGHSLLKLLHITHVEPVHVQMLENKAVFSP